MGVYSVLRRLHPNLLLNDTPRLVTCYLQLALWVLDHVFAHYLKEFHTRLFDGFKFGSACFFALVKQHAITLHHEHRTGLHSSFSFTWWFKNKEAIHFKIKTVTSTFRFCLLFSNIWKSQSCQIWNGGETISYVVDPFLHLYKIKTGFSNLLCSQLTLGLMYSLIVICRDIRVFVRSCTE